MALDGRMKGAESAEMLGGPLAREHGRTGDGEPFTHRIGICEARGRARDVAKRGPDRAREDPAGLGEDDTSSRLLEERDAERILQAAQLMTDGLSVRPSSDAALARLWRRAATSKVRNVARGIWRFTLGRAGAGLRNSRGAATSFGRASCRSAVARRSGSIASTVRSEPAPTIARTAAPWGYEVWTRPSEAVNISPMRRQTNAIYIGRSMPLA